MTAPWGRPPTDRVLRGLEAPSNHVQTETGEHGGDFGMCRGTRRDVRIQPIKPQVLVR